MWFQRKIRDEMYCGVVVLGDLQQMCVYKNIFKMWHSDRKHPQSTIALSGGTAVSGVQKTHDLFRK